MFGTAKQLRSTSKTMKLAANEDLQVRTRSGAAMPSPSPVDPLGNGSAWMSPEFIDAVARRMMELGVSVTVAEPASHADLLTVAEVARRLNVSPQWVYAHKQDLGAIRLGDGPKARLRFDAPAVLAELSRRNGAAGSGCSTCDAPKRARRRLASRPLPRVSRGS